MPRFLRAIAVLVASAAAVTVLLALVVAGVVAWHVREGAKQAPAWDGGRVTTSARPKPMAAPHPVAVADGKQVLFGDLHVHTSFSADAFGYALPLYQGAGARPPADACDFARFCSQLDFWSINDHAESLGAAQWTETVRAIRECNAAARDPDSPDMVSFLGWEWSQGATEPNRHFGHKNVVLRETERVPARPVAAGTLNPFAHLGISLYNSWAREAGGGTAAAARAGLHGFLAERATTPRCADGVDVRALSGDCAEVAETPDVLFEKLAQWDLPAIVIPHGTAWGVTNPPHADAVNQLAPGMHDERWQRLIEVYSGHGSSEEFAPFVRASVDAEGRGVCPAATDRFEPCCQRAGELVRARCADPASAACAGRVAAAREEVARRMTGPLARVRSFTSVVPEADTEEWGDCGQLRDGFLPANGYRPRHSAQYASARGNFEDTAPAYWRLGFIGSSDNHKARPGTGFKEFGRLENTEGFSRGQAEGAYSSYFFTGGLAAVHAEGRSRDAIFAALERREVYGTSGERILLWFDLLDGEARHPMGSRVARDAAAGPPRFEVRAAGAFAQRPGCPEWVSGALGPERLDWLCMNECHHPGERRKDIARVEVVRIRPQLLEAEPVAGLIEDPWKVLPCDASAEGCTVHFEDPDFGARETLYYVRAIQEPSPAVNGDPLRCERRAEDGRCLRARFCPGTGLAGDPPAEDCLAPVEERAWSSPIWLAPGGA